MNQAPTLFLKGTAAIGGVPVFRELEIEVPAGQWTCLLGSSGVGKTTLLKLFAGLDDAIEFTGNKQTGNDGGDDRAALMAQDDLLMPWLTVRDNVELGARLRGEKPDRSRAMKVLERVGLGQLSGRKPRELSGGQRQRVALARTLMEDRPVVLLDEPFSSLDARTRAQMQELTAEVLSGCTVLLVTHDPAEASRLGQTIKLMTENGIEDIAPPAGKVPRPVDDKHVLRMQTSLLARLREAA